MSHNNLNSAKKRKNDEFYTELSDIENELMHYKDHFKGKVVFCNCDDPRVSKFFHYFSYNFKALGLKKLITTCYKNQNPDSRSENKSDQAVYLEYTGSKNGDKIPNPKEIGIKHLKGDGDFRSDECIELLKQSDIVVTNPPFSLFREYVAQLIEYDKKFIIIGNKNAITYKDIFKFIKGNKMWLGYGFKGGVARFKTPCGKDTISVPGVWFTNLEIEKIHEEIILYKKYNEKEYPKYDNYDAINVDKVKDIPCDYKGNIGVPVTFLNKFNPDQFEIVGLGISNSGKEFGVRPYKEEHKKYRKEIQQRGAVDGDLYMIINEIVDVPYARIVIKNKKLN